LAIVKKILLESEKKIELSVLHGFQYLFYLTPPSAKSQHPEQHKGTVFGK